MHKSGYFYYVSNIISSFGSKEFEGWGRKKSGNFSLWCHKKFGGRVTLYEDGFIRSLGLGVDGAAAFSHVEDDVGIYYDATKRSQLENILNTYDFDSNEYLMEQAKEAIALIKKYHISKYNCSAEMDSDFFKNDTRKKVLIVAQTSGDASLKYGKAEKYSTKMMIADALSENVDASIYMKMHPDVLSGKKKSDISLSDIPERCMILDVDVNPVSLLQYMDKVYTKTSGMGMEALILGKDVVCYGLPYYAGWGLTQDKQSCDRRTRKLSMEALFAGAYILYTKYYNPFSEKKSDILDTIQTIVKYREIYKQNENSLYFFGFSWWKRSFVKFFFPAFKQNKIIFCTSLADALKRGFTKYDTVFIWGKKPFHDVEDFVNKYDVDLCRVEDGFIRSLSLGSDLTKAYSLVVDRRGIYFDPTQESDLEHILNTYTFDDALLVRAKALQQYLVKHKISKYNIDTEKNIVLSGLKPEQRIILVPGQVEDDASIVFGADGMTNLELLQKVREKETEAYIIYKPHPDVLAGNRVGNIAEDTALHYCDTVLKDVSLDSVLILANEVHTMTSLVGFEALVRGKSVKTYGLPFYAGWGLTIDDKHCERRKKKRTLLELVAATFILYPRYIHPKRDKYCEVEVLLHEIEKEKKRYTSSMLYRIYINSRNIISRKIQWIIRITRFE